MKKIAITFLAVLGVIRFALSQSWTSIQLVLPPTVGFLREANFWGDTGVVISANGNIFYSYDFFNSFTVDSQYNNNLFDAMTFVTRETGYITSCTVQGGMLKTTDGGNTWSPLPFGPSTGSCIGENFLFTSTDTGYSAWREASNSFWFTFDGGQNWSSNQLPYEGVFKIESVQDSVIYVLIVNKFVSPYGILRLYSTLDYGVHWQNAFNSAWSVTKSSDFHFIDDTTLILAADGVIMKSKDSGFSFDTLMLGDKWIDMVSENVRAISFVDRDTGFVAFAYGVYKTFDAGETWIKTDFVFDSLDIDNGNYITFVKAISSQKVVLGCYRGNIYKTETGGGVWSDIK